jgi:inosine-uridine nucleoside N-ribohydrolase
MAAVLDPGCATIYDATIDIDTGWSVARGMTAVDLRPYSGRPHNARVVAAIDSGRFEALLERAFAMECRI